jgi:hypothetical protein
MHPVIPAGSDLYVESLPPALSLGDLLAFVQSSRTSVCCHRVIAVREDGAALTQGDNNGAPDGWVEPARHVGVVRRYRTGGRWYDAREAARPSGYRRFRQRVAMRLQRSPLFARARWLRSFAVGDRLRGLGRGRWLGRVATDRA